MRLSSFLTTACLFFNAVSGQGEAGEVTKPSTVASTKSTTVSTKSTTVSTKSTTVSTKSTTVSTKSTTVSTKPTTVSTKPTTVSTKSVASTTVTTPTPTLTSTTIVVKKCSELTTCFGCYTNPACKFCTVAKTTPAPSTTTTSVSSTSSVKTEENNGGGGGGEGESEVTQPKPFRLMFVPRGLAAGKCVEVPSTPPPSVESRDVEAPSVDPCSAEFPEELPADDETCKATTCSECVSESGWVWMKVDGKPAGCVPADECKVPAASSSSSSTSTSSQAEGGYQSNVECLQTCKAANNSKDAAAHFMATLLTSGLMAVSTALLI